MGQLQLRKRYSRSYDKINARSGLRIFVWRQENEAALQKAAEYLGYIDRINGFLNEGLSQKLEVVLSEFLSTIKASHTGHRRIVFYINSDESN